MTRFPTLTADLITSRAAFARHAVEWDDLFGRATNPRPWRRHAWLLLAWRRGARAVIVREDGRPVMAGAFILGLRRLRPVVTFLAASIPQTDDVLHAAGPDTAAQADLLLRTLARSFWLPRQLRVRRLPENSPLHSAPCLQHRSEVVQARMQSFAVAIAEHADFEAYMQSRGGKVRLEHRRRLRRLGEQGAVELRREPGAEAGETIAWMLDRKRQWLQRTHQDAAWLSSGGVDGWLSRLQLVPAAATWSLWSLRVDGLTIAAMLSFEERDAWVFHILAHDERFSLYAPGSMINLLAIERAFAEGVGRIELGVTGDTWKRRLAMPTEMIFTERFRL